MMKMAPRSGDQICHLPHNARLQNLFCSCLFLFYLYENEIQRKPDVQVFVTCN